MCINSSNREKRTRGIFSMDMNCWVISREWRRETSLVLRPQKLQTSNHPVLFHFQLGIVCRICPSHDFSSQGEAYHKPMKHATSLLKLSSPSEELSSPQNGSVCSEEGGRIEKVPSSDRSRVKLSRAEQSCKTFWHPEQRDRAPSSR